MLKSIYDYAVENNLSLPPGFAKKTVKFYISLATNGTFLGILEGPQEPILCPDIGSAANGPDKSNPLAEKASVVLGDKNTPKSSFFRNTMEAASEYEPELKVCLNALNDENTFEAICAQCEQRKVKGLDRISFSVGGKSILDSQNIVLWWKNFRKQFKKTGEAEKCSPCLITGELTEPVATVPTVSGLAVVGGHSKGDALICFDKPSFQSYGLKQSANAPVSEEAFSTVKAGLDNLLKTAPILAGMKFVYWYDKPVPLSMDKINSLISSDEIEEDDDDEEDDKITAQENAIAQKQNADDLIAKAGKGISVPPLASQYTILMLSGVNGRVMVRSYEHGSFEALTNNIALWEKDIALVKPGGLDNIRPCKFTARLAKLLSRQKNDKKLFDRLSKELPGLTVATLNSILNGNMLPDSVAIKALNYIRSEMLETNEDQKSVQVPIPNGRACQWLKAWLVRKHRFENKEEHLMAVYNPNHPEAAYHCGALTCVYANIQHLSDPYVNANIIQKYYASVCQTPALVLGQLARLSMHHQEKITKKGLLRTMQEKVENCYAAMKNDIPGTLSLEQQSLFALGFYQMSAELNREKKSRLEKDIAEETDEN